MRTADIMAILDSIDEHGTLTAYIVRSTMYNGQTIYMLWRDRITYKGRVHPRLFHMLVAQDMIRDVEQNEHGHSIYRPYREDTGADRNGDDQTLAELDSAFARHSERHG